MMKIFWHSFKFSNFLVTLFSILLPTTIPAAGASRDECRVNVNGTDFPLSGAFFSMDVVANSSISASQVGDCGDLQHLWDIYDENANIISETYGTGISGSGPPAGHEYVVTWNWQPPPSNRQARNAAVTIRGHNKPTTRLSVPSACNVGQQVAIDGSASTNNDYDPPRPVFMVIFEIRDPNGNVVARTGNRNSDITYFTPAISGTYTATATAHIGMPQYIPEALWGDSVTKTFNCDSPEYKVGAIDIEQVLENIDANLDSKPDLIRGKSFSVSAQFLTPQDNVASNETFSDVTLAIENDHFVSKLISRGSITTDSMGRFTFDVSGTNLISAGEYRITVFGKKSNSVALIAKSKPLSILQSKNFSLALVPIVDCENGHCFDSPISDLSIEKNASEKLIEAMFPIPDSSVNAFIPALPGDVLGGNSSADLKSDIVNYATVVDEIRQQTGLRPDRVALIVGNGAKTGSRFFKFYGVDQFHPILAPNVDRVAGLCSRRSSFCLVEEGFLTTIPHELGHSFCTRYDGVFGCAGNLSQADAHPKAQDEFVSDGYLNYSIPEIAPKGKLANLKNLMSQGGGPNVMSGQWIDRKTYQSIFNTLGQMTVRRSEDLQRVLRVIGRVSGTGDVEILDTQSLPAEVPSVSEQNATFNLIIRASNGSVLSSTKFEPLSSDFDFQQGAGMSPTVDGIDRYFSLYVPYTDGAFSIEFTNSNGIEKLSFIQLEIGKTLLKRIPDSAFLKDAVESRIRLVDALGTVEDSFKNADFEGGKIKFQAGFMSEIGAQISSNFSSRSLFSLSSSKVARLKDQVSADLATAVSGISASGSAFFDLVPQGTGSNGRLIVDALIKQEPTNPEDEVYISGFLNGSKIRSRKVNNKKYSFEIPKTISSGKLVAFSAIRSKRTANSLDLLLDDCFRRMSEIDKELDVETDPEKIAYFIERKAFYSRRVIQAKTRLDSIARSVGRGVFLEF